MGVGGLLKEIDTRPLPREKAPATPQHRRGPAQRADHRRDRAGGRPVAAHGAAQQAAGRGPHRQADDRPRGGQRAVVQARPILVVTGHQAEQVQHALGGRPVRYVHAADYAEGLSASLKAGIAAVPEECAAALVCLGDMPLVTGRMIDRLLGTYDPDEGRLIVLPTFRGKQGNPMLWDRRFFSEILQISGDSGARFLLGKHLEAVAEVEMADDAVLRDFDTTDSLNSLPQRLRPEPIG